MAVFSLHSSDITLYLTCKLLVKLFQLLKHQKKLIQCLMSSFSSTVILVVLSICGKLIYIVLVWMYNEHVYNDWHYIVYFYY